MTDSDYSSAMFEKTGTLTPSPHRTALGWIAIVSTTLGGFLTFVASVSPSGAMLVAVWGWMLLGFGLLALLFWLLAAALTWTPRD